MDNFTFYSAANLEPLSSMLFEELAKDRKMEGIFYKPTIVIQNKELRTYLERFFLKKVGISINIEFDFLESVIIKLVREIKKDKKRYIFLGSNKNKSEYEDIIFSILKKYIGIEDSLSIIERYIGSGENTRLYLAAKKLAMFFRDYEFQRVDMIESWRKGERYSFENSQLHMASIDEIERLERFIYQKILEIIEENDNLTTLMNYISDIDNEDKYRPDISKKIVYFFGFSEISQEHYNILLKISRFYKIKFFHIDLFNPTFPVRYMKDGTICQPENRLLKSLAMVNIKNTTLFLERESKRSEAALKPTISFERAEPKELHERTLLAYLKNSINGYKIEEKIAQDKSLQIFNSPTVEREVETVFNSIIYNLSADDRLKQSDVAIFVSDMEQYGTAIKAVFDREWLGNSNFLERPRERRFRKILTYNNLSLSGVDTLFGDALITILGIDRDTIFDDIAKLFQNRFFLKCNNLKQREAKVLIGVLRELKSIEGFDFSDRDSPYSIVYGIERVALSKILPIPPYSKIDGETKIIPYDMGFERDAIEKSIPLLYEVLKYVWDLREDRASFKLIEWCEKFREFIDKFFNIKDKNIKDREIIRESSLCIEVIKNLKSIGRRGSSLNDKLTPPFTLKEAVEFLKDLLSNISIEESVGGSRAEGITISTLDNFRSIPKKIVYLIGLNDNLFPKKNIDNILDIRTLDRSENDVMPIDKSKNLFMELLLSVEERLYLSYCGDDIVKEKKLYHSSVLHNLKQYIEENLLPYGENGKRSRFREIRIPLKGYDELYFDSKDRRRESYVSITDLFNNYSYMDYMVFKIMSRGESPLVKKNQTKKDDINLNETDERSITIADLKRLIRYPIETKFSKLFNIFEEREHEKIDFRPIYVDRLTNWEIVHPFISEYISKYFGMKRASDKNSLDEDKNFDLSEFIENNFDRYFKYSLLTAKTPATKPLLEISREELAKSFSTYAGVIEPLKERYRNFISYSAVEFTDSTDEKRDNIFRMKPIEFKLKKDDSKTLNIGLTGRYNLSLFQDKESGIYEILVLSTSGEPKREEQYITHHILEPLLFFFSALVTIDGFQEKIVTTIIYKDGVVKRLEFSAVRDEAEKFLNNLIYYMFDDKNFDSVDFDMVNKLYTLKTDTFNFGKYLEQMDKSEADSLSLAAILESPLLREEELQDIIDERFKLAFSGVKYLE